MSVRPRPRVVAAAALFGAVALVGATALPAQAHVTVSSATATAGAYAVLTFSVPHGCDGSATTRVAIQIPQGINAVTPTRNANWQVDKAMEKLETPIEDSHGNKVSERVGSVVYTADTPLPDGYRDAFELSLQIPQDAAGQTLYFPVVQTCEKGETGWVQKPASGQSSDDLEHPAPSLIVGPAAEDGAGHGAGSSASPDAQHSESTPVTAAADQTPLVVTSLVVGLAGLAAGVTALVRGRRK